MIGCKYNVIPSLYQGKTKEKKGTMSEKQLEILMYPWFAMGHIIPNVQLANKLAERGHKITLLLPNKVKLKLQSSNLHPSLMTFHTITIPHVDPLPLGTETVSDIPSHLETHLVTALDLTRPEFESILVTLQPDFVFSDCYWVPEVVAASGARAKCVSYNVVSAAALAFTMIPFREPPKDRVLVEEDACVAQIPPGYPSSTAVLEPKKLLRMYNPFGEGTTFYERISNLLKYCDIIAIKTCWEIEGKYCEYLSSQFNNKPVLLTGPIHHEPAKEEELNAGWVEWLGQFKPSSVVFCVFGSQVVLDVVQFKEILLGFELTKLPFLVALKPPTGCTTVEEAFPEGFSEGVRGRGMVTGEWVPQTQILAHPSIGCFVSHCGFGSIWESMLSKNQIVLIPRLSDQVLFAKIITEELKVGVQVEIGEDGSWVSKENLCNAIKSVMDEESQIGVLVRKNHEIWRQKLGHPQFMDGYIDNFIKDLQALIVD